MICLSPASQCPSPLRGSAVDWGFHSGVPLGHEMTHGQNGASKTVGLNIQNRAFNFGPSPSRLHLSSFKLRQVIVGGIHSVGETKKAPFPQSSSVFNLAVARTDPPRSPVCPLH